MRCNSPKDRTEAEIREWYARAEAGTLSPPPTPEEMIELISFLDEIKANNAYPVLDEKIEGEIVHRKEATFSASKEYRFSGLNGEEHE